MNPLPIIRALLLRNLKSTVLFATLIACAVALGVAISAQERSLRKGSAQAADKFDVIVAAPGSHTDVMLAAVFLRPLSVPLMDDAATARALTDTRATFSAPIAFGDSFEGHPVVGTTADFVNHLADGLAEGRMFSVDREAVVGASVPHEIGESVDPVHGHGPEALLAEGTHGVDISITGRLHATGTPWDNAIIVPVELVWHTHALPRGHAFGDNRIGPPFDPDRVPGVPAVVFKPEAMNEAYKLRGDYRSESTTAFFPAEVLVQLYEVLGNVGQLMRLLALASQALVIAATLAGVLAIVELYRRELAILRALGATRSYVFLVIWGYVFTFVATGALAGLALGAVATRLVSTVFTTRTGIALPTALSSSEFLLVGGLVLIGSLLAALPAWITYRRPVLDNLR